MRGYTASVCICMRGYTASVGALSNETPTGGAMLLLLGLDSLGAHRFSAQVRVGCIDI